ncbi:MAG: AraC family transcriptional regulator [Bacteroidota bacterium]
MKEFLVPDHLVETPGKTGLIWYQNDSDLNKGRVNFTQFVFSFLLEGRKELFAPDGFVELGKDEFVLIGSATCLMTERRSPITESYQSVLFTFSQTVLADFKFKHREKISSRAGAMSASVLKFPHDPFTRNFVHSLQILGRHHQHSLYEVKLEELLLYLLHEYPTVLQTFLSAHEWNRELELRKIVENNISSNLSIEELAFLCNMSPSTFKRHFTRQYQQPPQRWIAGKRLDLAQYWIAEGKRPKEIYAELGYTTLSNFIRAYKKHFGVSTRAHRNELL